jgi:hypothetical protein
MQTHLLASQSLGSEITATAVETPFDETRVEAHKVLHLLLLDDLRGGREHAGQTCMHWPARQTGWVEATLLI